MLVVSCRSKIFAREPGDKSIGESAAPHAFFGDGFIILSKYSCLLTTRSHIIMGRKSSAMPNQSVHCFYEE